MKMRLLPMALGPEPEGMAGPFAIRTSVSPEGPGFALLRIASTGLHVTACLTAPQLRQLAAMAAAAAREIEGPANNAPAAAGGAEVVSIFTAKP